MTRRRTATSRAVLGLVVVACVALAVFSALTGWPETFWGWVLRAGVPLAVLALAWRDYARQTGRLARMRNRGLGALALVLGLAALSLTVVAANRSTPQLGLDLQGGFSVVLTAKGDPADDTIDQAMEIIRQRIDGLGVAEPEVTRQGDNVVVELPGVKDRARAQEVVGTTAKLEFRPVLQPNITYSQEAADAGRDPCLPPEGAAPAPAADPGAATTPADPGATTPADPSATTAPGATTAPPATTATGSAETTAPPADEQGAPVPGPRPATGVVDGENAGPPIPGRQTPDPSSTTAPSTGSTTAPPASTAPGQTTAPAGSTAPAAPAAPAPGSVVLPLEGGGACMALGPPAFEGAALSKATAALGQAGQSAWTVNVTIKGNQRDAANDMFNACNRAEDTCPAAGQGGKGLAAIVLDDQVVSAPEVNNPDLANGEFTISGGGTAGFTEGQAKDLALKLRYGALPVEFTRSAERQVSPTLGDDSLRAGVLAGGIGLVAVALYLLAYYRALGVVVVLGLGVWGALMYGVVCWLSSTQGLTLSLAGVVGIVVSLGTTVDSYVVHFERLKDEVRLGKSVRSSTEKGFQKAFRTILTADLASLMGAALLWYLTVGAVRGFAFFLGLSVVLDLFVAYCFDRPVVALLARSSFFTENRIFGVARGLGRSDGGASTVGARS
ncbi:MAG TPA: protein translocase subunit SecD [Acidimicrobiales bacterium]|nr:protein translocase subunit SecD [Acidimicrobiales bacterium]